VRPSERLRMKPFVTFMSAVAFFHFSEFLLASVYMRKDLSRRCEFEAGIPAAIRCPPDVCWQALIVML